MSDSRTLIRNPRCALLLAVPLALAGLAGCGGPGPTRPPTGRIAFMDGRVGNAEIWVMNADGTDQTNLTNNAAIDAMPAWSPDGRRIAFHRYYDGLWDSQVWVMNADGSEQRRLTNKARGAWEPCWSPAGHQIAFWTPGRGGLSVIHVVDADGSGAATPLAQGYDPAWSPDGAKIAFHRYHDGPNDAEVYVMNADGTDQTALTSSPGRDTDPAWSPDGRKIAFTSAGRGMCVMNPDGTGQTLLLGYPYGPPTWSPDGRNIAFVADLEPDDDYHLGLYVVSADGAGRRLLADDIPYEDMGGDERAVWSPDGRYIAYTSGSPHMGEPTRVSVVNVHSGRQVEGLPGRSAQPAWCPVP